MKARLLIVDDEKEFTETLSERLTIREYHVATSYSGKDALGKIETHNFDVVILDVSMPGMDGIETLREIKKIKPLTEVIMLTGKATVESAIDGMKMGAVDYLMKPCDTGVLEEKINMAHKRRKEHEERIQKARIKEIIESPRSALKKH